MRRARRDRRARRAVGAAVVPAPLSDGRGRRRARRARGGGRALPAGPARDALERFARGMDRRPDALAGALRRDVRPAPPGGAGADLLRARRHARARHGAAAAQEALPRRRAADRTRRELPDHLTVMLAFAALARAGPRRGAARRAPAGDRAAAPVAARPREPVRARARRRRRAAAAADRLRARARSRGSRARARPRRRSGWSRTGRRRRCRPGRAHERRRDPAVDHPALRRDRDVPRRALVALPRRPVRLDEPLDAAVRAQDPRLGRPGVPLRRAGRRRRPRHRADDPEVVHRGDRDVGEHVPLVLGGRGRGRRRGLRRRVRRASCTGAPRTCACGGRRRAPTCSSTSCWSC